MAESGPSGVATTIRRLESGVYRLYVREFDPDSDRTRILRAFTFGTRAAAEDYERSVHGSGRYG